MNVAHVCNGLGGSLWTGAILDWRSVYAVDFDPWRCDRVRDQAGAGWWPDLHIECADLSAWEPPTVDGGVDGLAAGFSCRDISAAGRGAGIGGASTGPTYAGCLRAIDAWRPAWIFLENSPRIVALGRDVVTRDLVALGYRWRDGVIAAADVGAGHERQRWFLLARLAADLDGVRELEPRRGERAQRRRTGHGHGHGQAADPPGIERRSPAPTWDDDQGQDAGRRQADGWSGCRSDDATDSLFQRLQIANECGWIREDDRRAIEAAAGYCGAHHWNPPHPGILPVVDGVADRSPRGDKTAWISALGDAWVPLQAAAAFSILWGDE